MPNKNLCQISRLIGIGLVIVNSGCANSDKTTHQSKPYSQEVSQRDTVYDETLRPFNHYIEALKKGNEIENKARLNEAVPNGYKDRDGLQKFLHSEFGKNDDSMNVDVLNSYALLIKRFTFNELLPALEREVLLCDYEAIYAIETLFEFDSKKFELIENKIIRKFPKSKEWIGLLKKRKQTR